MTENLLGLVRLHKSSALKEQESQSANSYRMGVLDGRIEELNWMEGLLEKMIDNKRGDNN